MLGRIFGALTALAQAGIPIGAVLAGVVVQQAGLVPTILGMGVICLLMPLGMFFNRPLDDLVAFNAQLLRRVDLRPTSSSAPDTARLCSTHPASSLCMYHCEPRPWSVVRFADLGEVLVDGADADSAFSDGGGDAFD
jgi:hypothetical protein